MASRTKDKKIQRAISKLKKIYKQIPDTQGCMKNIAIPEEEGGCGAWCCKEQSPSVLKIEFLHTWRHIIANWTIDQVADTLEAALRNYVSSKPIKGCIFWDQETKMCKQHKTRPFNCHIYGITPEEEFAPRVERLRVLYKDKPGVVIKDQCNLVSVKKGKPITVADTSRWWAELKEVEESIGIKKKHITDEIGGSYRTYHDHLLLYICSDHIMTNLETLKLHGTEPEKDFAIQSLMGNFRSNVQKQIAETAASQLERMKNENDSSKGN